MRRGPVWSGREVAELVYDDLVVVWGRMRMRAARGWWWISVMGVSRVASCAGCGRGVS